MKQLTVTFRSFANGFFQEAEVLEKEAGCSDAATQVTSVDLVVMVDVRTHTESRYWTKASDGFTLQTKCPLTRTTDGLQNLFGDGNRGKLHAATESDTPAVHIVVTH